MSSSATPILTLPQGTEIKSILTCDSGVFLGLSDGRILRMDGIYRNAYLTGERSIYAQVQDAFGQTSGIGWSNLLYRLSNKILRLNNASVVNSYDAKLPFSATQTSSVIGVFTSPVLFAGSDFGYWDQLIYAQSALPNTKIRIGIRVGNTEQICLSATWRYFESQNENVTVDLSGFNQSGAYIQSQIELTTLAKNLTPLVSSLTLSFKTRYAVYLFTRRFDLDSNTNLKSGIITANITSPLHTKVIFGISGKDSNDWSEYTPVTIDESFAMPESIKSSIKIGVKMASEISTDYASVAGFSIMLSGDVENQINQMYQSSSSSSTALKTTSSSSSSLSSISSSSLSSESSSSLSSESSSNSSLSSDYMGQYWRRSGETSEFLQMYKFGGYWMYYTSQFALAVLFDGVNETIVVLQDYSSGIRYDIVDTISATLINGGLNIQGTAMLSASSDPTKTQGIELFWIP